MTALWISVAIMTASLAFSWYILKDDND